MRCPFFIGHGSICKVADIGLDEMIDASCFCIALCCGHCIRIDVSRDDWRASRASTAWLGWCGIVANRVPRIFVEGDKVLKSVGAAKKAWWTPRCHERCFDGQCAAAAHWND